MPSDRFELRLSFQKLLVGMLLTLVPISLAGFYCLNLSERALERTIGSHFKTIGESTASEVSYVIHDLVSSAGVMAADAAVTDAIVTSNRGYQGAADAAIAARIERIDKAWNTPAVDATVKEILSSRASRVLRRCREMDPRFLRVTVTDERGAVVAATHKTLDYYQADEAYWQGIYANGRGAVSLTDVLYDEVTKSSYIGIGVPVMEEGTNRFIGTLDALVDVSSLAPLITRVQFGRTSRAILVKEDGTVIAAPQANLAMKLKSEEHASVAEAIATLEGRQTGYAVADLRGGRTVIGFADTGLKRDYGNLSWVVLVCQDAVEAFAPIRVAGRLIGFMSALGLVMVTLVGVYFSIHRRHQLEEIGDLHREARAQAATGK